MPKQGLEQKRLLETAFLDGRAEFEAVIAKYPKERFYAFCFYTDNDVTSVFPTANTVEGIDRIFDPTLESRLYYRWNPAEWKLDFGNHRLMVETNNLLYPSFDPPEPEEPSSEFGKRKRDTIRTLNAALLKIRESGIFSGHSVRDRIAFWLNIGDAMPGEIEWMFQPVLSHLDREDIDELRKLFVFRCN